MDVQQFEHEWLAQIEGKTIKSVRPKHRDNPVPEVHMTFEDGDRFVIYAKRGVYFEGCMINTLRKARPVSTIEVAHEDGETFMEIRCSEFPLLMLCAQNTRIDDDDFPWILMKDVRNG